MALTLARGCGRDLRIAARRLIATPLFHDVRGVRMEGIGIAQLNFYTQGLDEARARRALDRVLDQARQGGNVESIAVSTGMPFGTHSPGVRVSTPDKPFIPKALYPSGTFVAATPDIFRTIGVPILSGRAFDDRDHAGAAPVVVISQFTARTPAFCASYLPARRASKVDTIVALRQL